MALLITICGRDIRVQGHIVRTARLDADKYQFLEDPATIINELKKSHTRIDLFTFLQRLPDTAPQFQYPMEWDNLAVLPIMSFDYWWREQIGFKARNKAKQAAKKGLVIREVPFNDALVKGIWEVYNECPIRQGDKSRHYGKSIDIVYKEEATFLESSIFVGAFFGEALVGFIKLVHDETRTQAGLMNIISMVKHRDKAPTNALIAQAVRVCAERKIPYLVYSNFSYGKKQNDSLSDFKERNGFRSIAVPRYYVPLTRVGWNAFRLGLHHRWVDHLPAPVTAKLRELRGAWYRRKLASITEPV